MELLPTRHPRNRRPPAPHAPAAADEVAHLRREVAEHRLEHWFDKIFGGKKEHEGEKKEKSEPGLLGSAFVLLVLLAVAGLIYFGKIPLPYSEIHSQPTPPLSANEVEIGNPDVRGYPTLKGALDGNISGSSTWATKVRLKIAEYSIDKRFFLACDSAPTPNCYWFRDGPGILRGN